MIPLESVTDLSGAVAAVEAGSALTPLNREPITRLGRGEGHSLPVRRRRLARAYRHALDRAGWC